MAGVLALALGGAKSGEFLFDLRIERNHKTGKPNFLGPYAHGKPDELSLYLCWGLRRGPLFQPFQRAKIHLNHLDWKTVVRAIQTDRPIEAVVRLTDKKVSPLCASVKSDHIEWKI